MNPHGQSMDSYVFWAGKMADKPMEATLFADGLREALIQTGMSEESAKVYTFHGWRHYFTSYMREQMNEKLLQAQTGHKTLVMLNHYSGHKIPSRYLYVLVYTTKGNYFESPSQSIGVVDFGKTAVGSISRTSTFYISIQGTSGSAVNLTDSPTIQLSGANADCFSVSQPSITTANTGTYIMDASISFSPTSTGMKTATITIPNNSPDKPNFLLTITGEGSIWPKIFDGGEGDGDDAPIASLFDSNGNLYFVGYGFELVNNHSGSDWWIKNIILQGLKLLQDGIKSWM